MYRSWYVARPKPKNGFRHRHLIRNSNQANPDACEVKEEHIHDAIVFVTTSVGSPRLLVQLIATLMGGSVCTPEYVATRGARGVAVLTQAECAWSQVSKRGRNLTKLPELNISQQVGM